jgi:phosphatidylserine decarboxylase
MSMGSGTLAAWREVKAIVLALSGATLLAWWTRQRGLSLIFATLLGWVFFFFRDPERIPVSASPDWILAPADGKVTDIGLVQEPHFFKGPARRVTIFLSLFDVHVQRCSYQGLVSFRRYQPGRFAPAFLKKADDNEANLVGISTPHGPIAIRQVTGVLARRVVCWPQVGDRLSTGQRLGLIKFGSRVDLLLPPQVELLAHVGQQVYGGQTIIARWPPGS